ncbi:uncharacterized protein LOC109712692 isoform X1 [Ananas comosus]|uniref:Uncharacterized protein LOC109712692 isoform X1 n=2 Tax=Ananas comosus TaxID=4615 RepID=A0A6P5F8S2_ANACO|nr:uncharacterized protein LOC109712692 isoform X1 [Ananas comosus]CAD1841658.1 unnamed protein product [Ananas comosus var. bracteatus]
MRVSLYKCHCPIICCSKCYSPCWESSRDAHPVSSSPNPVTVAVNEGASDDQRIGDEGDEERGVVDEGKEEVLLKSSLKKQSGPDSIEIEKGGVKWRDFLGKDLAEVREFEPIESGESEDGSDDNSSCVCVIQ